MSTIIHQDYSIHVASSAVTPFDAYWTMDGGADNDPRYDSIHNTPIYTDGGYNMDMGAVGGIIGGALGPVNITSDVYSAMARTYSPNPSMTSNGSEVSMAFWLKKSRFDKDCYPYGVINIMPTFGVTVEVLNGIDPRIALSLRFVQQTGLYPAVTQCLFGIGSQYVNTSTDITATFPVVFDVWEFWHMSCDAGGVVSLSRNGGADVYMGGIVPVAPDFNKYQIAFGDTPPPYNWRRFNNGALDEVYFRGGLRFTPTQIAYLYNGGAGRTWPIVLPP